MSFFALEQRLNASVMRHTANAVGTLGAKTLPGIFENAYERLDGGNGRSSSGPTFLVLSADLPVADPVGEHITIRQVQYEIVEAYPDGSGMTDLILEIAS